MNSVLTIKELVVLLLETIKYLLTKWLSIMLVGLITGVITVLIVKFYLKPTYTARTTFVLSSKGSSGFLSGLAGQFGLDIGGSGDGPFDGDNIIEMFKSENIFRRIAFKSIGKDVFINLIILNERLDKGLKAKPYLASAYPFPSTVEKLSPLQDSLLRQIHQNVIKKYVSVDKLDKKLSYYFIEAKSQDPQISYYLNQFLLDETSQFYIETKTKSAVSNLNMIRNEADSISKLMSANILNTGEELDKIYNLNPLQQREKATYQKGQYNIAALSAAYTEAIKNLEIAKITLQRERPLYQIIDKPYFPLKAEKPGALKSALLASIFVCFFFSSILVLKRNTL